MSYLCSVLLMYVIIMNHYNAKNKNFKDFLSQLGKVTLSASDSDIS